MWKGTLSELELIPRGLLEPVWCKNNKCSTDKAAIIKGKRKWNAKKRFSVAFATANPPQIHSTSIFPM